MPNLSKSGAVRSKVLFCGVGVGVSGAREQLSSAFFPFMASDLLDAAGVRGLYFNNNNNNNSGSPIDRRPAVIVMTTANLPCRVSLLRLPAAALSQDESASR